MSNASYVDRVERPNSAKIDKNAKNSRKFAEMRLTKKEDKVASWGQVDCLQVISALMRLNDFKLRKDDLPDNLTFTPFR